MTLLTYLYRSCLRLPPFRGKHHLEALFRRMLAPPRFDVGSGIIMELDPFEWTQIDLMTKGCSEPRTIAMYHRLLAPGDVYVDVGAHVGIHTLMARSIVGATGSVVAIDPQPYNCEKIITNSRLNGFSNIVVHVAAVGEENGSITLTGQPPTDKARLSLRYASVPSSECHFVVPIVRLDELIVAHEFDRVDLLKIDVEGYELEVLRGLGNTVAKVRNILFEILPDSDPREAHEIAGYLTSAGFMLQTLDGNDWVVSQQGIENNILATRAKGLSVSTLARSQKAR